MPPPPSYYFTNNRESNRMNLFHGSAYKRNNTWRGHFMVRIPYNEYARRFVIYALFGVNRCAAGQATAQDYVVAFLIMIMQLAPTAM